jgi:hypothetical protein
VAVAVVVVGQAAPAHAVVVAEEVLAVRAAAEEVLAQVAGKEEAEAAPRSAAVLAQAREARAGRPLGSSRAETR